MTRHLTVPAALTLLGALCLAQPTRAPAQGVTVSASGNAGVQFTKSGSGSLRFGLNGGVNGSITSQTRAYTTSLSGGLGFSLNDGELDPRVSLGASFAADPSKRTRASFGVSYAFQPIDFELFDTDLTLINQSGTRTVTSLNASLSHDLDPLTVATLSTSYTHVDYDPVTTETVPSDNYRLSGSVSHQLNRRTKLSANAGLGWFTSENAVKTESFSGDFEAGISHELDNLTSVNASAGLSFINNEETVGTLRVADWTTALLFDAGITRAYSDGTMGLSLSQRVSPDSSGELVLNTALRGNLSYEINARSALAISAAIIRQSDVGGGDSETVLSLAPRYSLELAEGVEASAGYQIRTSDSGTDHQLNFGVSRALQFSR